MDKCAELQEIEKEVQVGTGLAIDLKDSDLKDLDLKTLKDQNLIMDECVISKCAACGRRFNKPRGKKAPRQLVAQSKEEYIAYIKKFYNDIPKEAYAEWDKWYGDTINVEPSLFAASTWLIRNHEKRKKDFMKFYDNWLRNEYTRATQPREEKR